MPAGDNMALVEFHRLAQPVLIVIDETIDKLLAMKMSAVIATFALTLTGVATLTLSLGGRAKPDDAPENVRPVRVQKIESGPIQEASVYSGEIRPRFETPMAFRVPGRIARRHVDVGSAVKRSQLLVTLDPADYQLSVQNLRAQ